MQSFALVRRSSRGIAFALALPAAIAIAAATASGTSLFHAHLEKSIPAAADTVHAAPTVIRLWFTERPELAVSSIALVGPGGARIATAKPHRDAKDEKEIAAEVTGAVRPGAYRVDWRTMGVDGHPVRGSFAFVVSAGAATSTPAPARRGADAEDAGTAHAP